jgi:hypothetical protein
MARTYILTQQEKAIIKEYLETGKKLEDFRVVVFRCRNLDQKTINKDVELIQKFLAKLSKKGGLEFEQ